MSVLDGTPVGASASAVGATLDTGQAGQPGTPSSETYTITVDGEEQQVTLDEMRNGYMRQANYTRKTQDLANERRQLEQAQIMKDALDRNPQQAIATIASHYGVQVGADPQQTVQPTAVVQQTDEYGDPITPVGPDPAVQALVDEVKTLRAQVSGVSVNQQARQLESELDRLGAVGEDRVAVLRHMHVNEIPTVELAYRDLHWADAEEALAAKAARESAEAQILEEKRATQGLVSASAGVGSGGLEQAPKVYGGSGLASALREAFQDTKQEFGIEDVAGLRFVD